MPTALAQPTVTSLSPARNAVAAPRPTNVVLGFSQPIGVTSPGNVRFYSQQRGYLNYSVSGHGTNTLTYDPLQDFRAGEPITVSVPATVLGFGNVPVVPHVYQFTAAATSGDAYFSSYTYHPIGVGCTDVVVGDIDNDGDLDFATANRAANTVNVTFGGGFFGFGFTNIYPMGTSPTKVRLVDINNDGLLDLLTDNDTNVNLNVRLNTGAGFFGPRVDYITGGTSQAFAIGDVNNDGVMDVLTANYNAGVVCAVMGTGSGTFSNGACYPAGSQPKGVTVGDLNNDGNLDLLSTTSTNEVMVRLGTGNGLFGSAATTTVGSAVRDIVVGDLNNDGNLDVVAANGGTPGRDVFIHLGDGTGSLAAGFTAYDVVSLGDASVALGDVDADGDLDIVTANAALSSAPGSDVRVGLNNGDGTFAPSTSFPLSPDAFPSALALGDVDNDGDVDFLTANQGPSNVIVGYNQPAPPVITALSPPRNSRSAAPGTDVTLTFSKLMSGAAASVNSLRVFSAQAGGRKAGTASAAGTTLTFNPGVDFKAGETVFTTLDLNARSSAGATVLRPHVYQFTTPAGGTGTFSGGGEYSVGTASTNVVTGDVNGDGHLDLVTTNQSAGTLAVSLNNGVGAFGGAVSYPAGTNPASPTLGDIDNDGDLDLLTTGFNAVNVRRNNGSGTFGPLTAIFLSGATRLTLGDLDGDGDQDLIVASFLPRTLSVSFNDGTGAFGTATNYASGGLPSAGPIGVTVGDVDNDGDLDVLTANQNPNIVVVYANNSYGTLGTSTQYAVSGGPQYVALADVDADGDLDFVATARTGNAVSVALNNGTGSFGAATPYALGTGPQNAAVGDVDGDGDPDVLATDAAAGVVNLILNDGTGAFGAAATFAVGTSPQQVVLADLDSDGDLDFVTANSGATAVSVRLNQDPADLVINNPQNVAGGVFDDVVVQAGGVANLQGDLQVQGNLRIEAGGVLVAGLHRIVGPGTFTLLAGGTLHTADPVGIAAGGPTGTVRVTGTRQFSPAADYGYDGTVTQITGSGLPGVVRGLTIDNPADVTLSSALNVTRGLALTSSGNLLLDDHALTLLSDATATAIVVNASTGVVVGSATVQRYITPGAAPAAYRHLSSPVANATVADLATASFTPRVNPAYNALPYVAPPASQFPNVLGFDETRGGPTASFTTGYFSPMSLAASLIPGRGYSLYLQPTTPDFVGTLGTGPITLPNLTRTGNNGKSGWQMLGNPYPSPMDWDNVSVPAGMSPTIWVWKSTGGSSGAYRTRQSNGNGTGTGNLPDGLLPMGQGFFAQVTGPGPVSFSFQNAHRVTTYLNPPLYRAATTNPPRLSLTLAAPGAGWAEMDETIVQCPLVATLAPTDLLDAIAPARNVGVPTLRTLSSGGEELAINALPEAALTDGLTIELLLDLPAAGAYTLAVGEATGFRSLGAELLDRATGTRYDLTVQPTVGFAAAKAGEVRGRFALVFGSRASEAVAELTLVPNPARGTVRLSGAALGAALLLDATGRTVRTWQVAPGTLDLSLAGLAPGVYVVRCGAATRRLVVE